MAMTFELKRNADGIVTRIIIDGEYEVRGKDGKVYNPRFANVEMTDYPPYLKEKQVKQMIDAVWKS